MYYLDEDFAHNYAISLSLDLETLSKVTKHPLPKDAIKREEIFQIDILD